MEEVTKRYDFIHNNKSYQEKKPATIFIKGVTIGVLAGSIITAYLLMTYSVFFL